MNWELAFIAMVMTIAILFAYEIISLMVEKERDRRFMEKFEREMNEVSKSKQKSKGKK